MRWGTNKPVRFQWTLGDFMVFAGIIGLLVYIWLMFQQGE